MGNALRALRRQRHLKAKDVADNLGISLSFYYKIEEGIRNPTMALAKRMADFFETTIDELFFSNETANVRERASA